MGELRVLHEAVVGAEEIDHLRHMNVRYYHEKALRASEALAAEHGLGPEACREHGGVLELRDAFTRHHREQLVGARLAVRGGVLALRTDGLRLYHELVNVDRDERAATFVHEVRLREAQTREPLPLPELVARSVADAFVEWPEHGRPRTLDLDRVPAAPPLEESRARGLAMRQERVIQAEECDATGHFVPSRYQELVWGGEPVSGRRQGPPLRRLAGGGTLGWATLESRAVTHELPRAGTRVQSFGAEVEIGGKITTRHMWVLDVERDVPVCTSSIVNLAFDLDRRRAIPIPADVRADLESQYHPDLR